MARKALGLSAAKVRAAGPGTYGDGGGLYLFVKKPSPKQAADGAKDGGAFWLFVYRSPTRGTEREMGLGPARGAGAVSLAEARGKRDEALAIVRAGRDPLDEREAAKAAAKAAAMEAEAKGKTFRDVTALYLAAHEAGWRNPKHRQQWENTLVAYVYPVMGDVPVSDVATGQVMACLETIWRATPETASRVRGRIEAVLDYATARGWRTGENPARWRGHLANLLPASTKVRKVQHHPALPWRDMGACMADLAAAGGVAALALRFAILTAARSGEARGATWAEVDMAQAVWTVPGERMKGGKPHRVPLSVPVLDVLRAVLPLRDRQAGDFVFPGGRPGSPLSDVALAKVLHRIGRDDVTVHGMRSTFRDWAAETTGYAREVAEAALAHVNADKVEAAYRRSDLFEKRRQMMEAWSTYCTRPAPAGEVVPIRRTAGGN